MLTRDQLQELVLRVVGVLVLVDQDMAEGGVVARLDLGEELEDVDHAKEQVVEVHGVHPDQLGLVELVGLGDGLLEPAIDHLRVVLGAAQLVLGVGDLVLDRVGREALGVGVDLVQAALDQAPRVGLVVDREGARVAQARRLGAQHPRAGRVEGHHPHRPRGVAEQQPDALAHLGRGLVGEGDREDLPRPRAPGVDQVGDAVREHARLARAGAREDEQRPVAGHDGLTLRSVETLEEIGDALVGGSFGRHRSRIGATPAGRRRQQLHSLEGQDQRSSRCTSQLLDDMRQNAGRAGDFRRHGRQARPWTYCGRAAWRCRP